MSHRSRPTSHPLVGHCPPRRVRPAIQYSVSCMLLLLALLAPLFLLDTPGVLAAGDVSVRVYSDIGRDGVDSAAAEPGVGGAAVALYTTDGLLAGLNNTDAGGAARFPDLPAGDYRVEVAPPAGFVVSVPGVANSNPGLLARVQVAGGASSMSVGLRPLAGGIDTAAPAGTRSITARVWDDLDGDGAQGASEPGLAGLALELLDSTNTLLQTAVAGPDGRYSFAAAPAGVTLNIRVQSPPAGYALTRQNAAPDARDSDGSLAALPAVVAPVPSGGRGANSDAVDIGFTRGAVSGVIWRDLDSDGRLDAGERRLDGVAVQLVDGGGTVVQSATSRSERGPGGQAGIYQFVGLPFGTYSLRVPAGQFLPGGPLAGTANSPNAPGGDQAGPDGIVAGDVAIGSVTLSAADVAGGSHVEDAARFGFYSGAAGDFVWFDLDRDGQQAGEENLGQNGLVLFVDDGRNGGVADNGIRDGGEPTTSTADDPASGLPGFYRFDDLPLGQAYRIVLDSSNFAAGAPLEGFGASTGTVGDVGGTPLVAFTTPVLSAGAPTAFTIDFGLVRAEVGNRVFEDRDGDGVYGIGDLPMSGVSVRLYSVGTGAMVRSVTSDADGLYSLPGLAAAPSYATFSLPAAFNDFVASEQLAGVSVDPAEASFVDYSDLAAPAVAPGVWRTPNFTPAAGAVNGGLDAGFYKPVAISARVFRDAAPLNNRWDGGESGLAGVGVALEPAAGGAALETRASDQNGLVTFSAKPGDYRLNVDQSDPDLVSASFVRVDPAADPIALGPLLSGQSALTEGAPAGSSNVFGFYQTVVVSGRLWFDSDGDGTRDQGEPPLQNVPVAVVSLGADLADPADDTVDAVVTAADGSYSSDGAPALPPGTFEIRVANPSPVDFAFVTVGVDNDIRTTGGGSPATLGTTARFSLPSGGSSSGNDGALTGVRSVGGRAFVDANADGRSTGDSGLAAVRVALTHRAQVTDGGSTTYLDATLAPLPLVTPAGGAFSFARLPRGSFDLAFTPPSGVPAWNLTAADVNAPADEAIDSDGELLNQALGGVDEQRDQGYFQNATITARVFDEQRSVDNAFQSGEPGVAGVNVTLNPGGVSRATDAAGMVSFSVTPGSYDLSVSGPAGFSPSPGNSGAVANLVVTSGQTGATQPFGYYKPGSVAGSAWYDADGDGQQEPGEPPMEALGVQLLDQAGLQVASATTDAAGAYSFADVDPTGLAGGPTGYRLVFAGRSGLAFAPQGVLATDNNSDAGAGGQSALFTLSSNGAVSYVDAGYVGALSLGDLVWADQDADGQQDGGEPGLAGATVTVEVTTEGGLINSGNPVFSFSATSTASASLGANYRIERVPPGSWRVVSVAPPFGFRASPADAGADAADSDPLGPRQAALAATSADLDFGFYEMAAIGDFVWLDLDADGRYDGASERGVSGVTVELLQGGSPVDQTTTVDGRYGFLERTPGDYSLRFAAPAGYQFSDDGAGSAAADDDNDARRDGTTAPISLASGRALGTIDAGLKGTGSLAGTVWLDENLNNRRDAAETKRVAGVLVTLTLSPSLTGGAATFTATTDASGAYSFANLPAGTGELRFQTPAGHLPVARGADSDGPRLDVTLAPGEAVAELNQGYRERGRLVWLPSLRGEPRRPDLVVRFSVSPAAPTAGKETGVEVMVTNQGTGPAAAFWVDLYINPSRTPQVNDPWNELCALRPCFGLAWLHEGVLQPGQSVSFNSRPRSAANPNGFRPEASAWPGFFANGTSQLYVIADSWNRDGAGDARDADGALRELDEANNRAGQSVVVAAGPLPPEFTPDRTIGAFTRRLR